MPRRRRNNDDWIFDAAKLFALVFVFGFLYPPAFWFLLVIVALLIGVLIVWRVIKSNGSVTSQFSQTPPSSPATLSVHVEPLVASSPSRTSRVVPPPNLIETLRAIDWFQFEKVVEILYRKLGYNVHRRGGANPDGGIDLVIEKDGIKTAIQCKQWKTWNVGVKVIREFLGALTDAGIQKGIFITLRGYTGDAKQLAEKHGIQIVHETELARLLEETHAPFDPDLMAALNDKTKFCPKCEREMVLRTASKGPSAGQQFWGCSRYPRCRLTMPCS